MTVTSLQSGHAPAFARPHVWLVVAAIAFAGMALRLSGSSGDLWLDEIWSLELVGGLGSIDQVFWRVNHDNNHFLNSAWLYLVGPEAPPLVHRALSVMLGVATVLAAAAATADRGPAAQLAAALMFAVSYPMVHYGSEARGYGGLILFSLLSIRCLRDLLDGHGSRLLLAVVILLGFLSHLTMAATVLVLVAWTAWTLFVQRGPARAALATIGIFLPALLALLPLAACVAYGISTHGFKVGGSTPYSLDAFLSGYGGIIAYLVGLPSWSPRWLLIAAASLLAAAAAWVVPGRRASLYLIGIVGLPVLMLQLRLPNMEFPRYFLPSAVLLLLCLAELIGRGLSSDGWRRIFAVLAVSAFLAGNGFSLWRFQESGRGSYAAVVERMSRDGDFAYASSNEFRTPKVVGFFAGRSGRQARLVPAAEWCSRRPEWLIVERRAEQLPAVAHPPGCDVVYERVLSTDVWGLSGIGWALFARTRP